ncbi:DUF3857 domain-containing protein [Acidithiobacillus ferrooxidans]|uniref:DUF3857 domain-containing protein n=2 Tax=Acidithiobacillaceae TaxID=225058 RepID=UPI000A6BFA8D|nr:DUF3857 domain-containing protein [Acidithiobacillus ferrooxidans]MCR2828726.1 DUF3857 domain-containing protein [Acidithiobacillus ferrooxidans]
MADLRVTKAYTLSPSGKMYAVDKNKIYTRTLPVVADAPEFSDAKAITVVFPHVAVGDDLVSDWQEDFKKPYFPNQTSISHTVPYFLQADQVHIVVHAPADMKLHWAGSGAYQVTHSVQGNTQTISATLQQAHPESLQPNAVSFYQVSPTFAVSTFPNWEAIGDAYWQYAQPAEKVTPEVQKLADKIAGDKTGKAAVQALYDWTVHHIRWVGVETGLSGYKPYPADTTLKQRYGDCKAAAALLVALLHARHIEAGPVLLGAGNDFTLQKVASIQRFNHVIVHVPQYDLYLDATSGYAPMGTIPLPDAHQPVILVGDHSKMTTTPGDGPEASGMTGTEKVSVNADGSLDANESLDLTGYGAWIWKDLLARVPMSEYGAVLHQALAQAEVMAQNSSLSTSPTHSLQDPFTIQAKWQTASGVPLSNHTRIHLHYGLNTASLRNLTARLSSPTVQYPAFMPYGQGEWSTVVTLPKGFSWKVQKHTEQVKNAAGAFTESITPLSADQLQVTYHMALAHMVYSPEQYLDLYKLVSQAYAISQEGFAVEK